MAHLLPLLHLRVDTNSSHLKTARLLQLLHLRADTNSSHLKTARLLQLLHLRVRSLLYSMGPEARPLLETFSLDAQSLASYQVVATRFTEHFVHPANELYESSRFHRCVQLPDESVDTLVRDRFVVGLRDSRLSDQVCRNAKLTLQDAWTQARQSEDADRRRRTEHSLELNLDAANANKFPSRHRSGAKPRSPQPQAERSCEPSRCEFCGRAPHRRSDCPARPSTCNLCKKKGHFAEVCRSRKLKQYKLSSVHLNAVATPASAKFVNVTVDDYTAQFKVDSGAEVSAVPSDFPTLPAKLDQVDTLLTGPGGQPLRVLGSYVARLRWHGKTSCQRLYVIQSLTVPLLGLPALQALQAVRFLDQLKTSKATLHAELFNGLGTLKDEYTIRLKPDAVPTGHPWEFLGMDLFQLNGQTFILVVDYYSRFPEVVTLRSTTAQAVIDALKSIFARHGIPQEGRSDNGPPFSSQEFAAFAASYGFNHRTSSPHYAQSNGEAERMVRTIKDLFRNSKDPYLALLRYRDTPGVNGFSPAQLLMGRQL
nr:uncharacterized protein LOC126535656 [Dermacentor andersoni]